MALRQREWVIYVRPFWTDRGNTVYYTRVPKVGRSSDQGMTGTDNAVAISIKRVPGSLADPGGGGSWCEAMRSYSISEIRDAYKQLLQDVPSNYIRICEEVPFDTMITPIS